jgi:hypothetical protein
MRDLAPIKFFGALASKGFAGAGANVVLAADSAGVLKVMSR